MADGKNDKTNTTAGTLLHRMEPGETRVNCAIPAVSTPLIVDTRNAMKTPLPHVFRLGSRRPQALQAEPQEPVEPVVA